MIEQTYTSLRHVVKRQARALNVKRPAVKKLQAKLTLVLDKFLAKQASMIAGQVHILRTPFIKADLSQDEIDQINAIVAGIDFAGWSVLAGEVGPLLDDIVKDGAYAALAQVNIDVEGRKEIVNIVSRDALAYSRERSAEMVGMRRDALGRLVENPNAEWAITDSTRDMVRTTLTESLKEGWSNQKIAAALKDSDAFSSARAMMIARTETILASNAGALQGYRTSGVVEGKIWTTAEDDKVSEDCQENGDQGPIPLDAVFASGDDAPPAHPNCRCAIAPYLNFSATAESGDADES